MFGALAKFRTKPPVAAQPSPPTKTAVEGNALYEALVCEFHWTALQIGAVTSYLSAAQQKNRLWVLRSCANLMPVEAQVVSIALKEWDEVMLPSAQATALQRIYTNLADAKRIIGPLVEACGSFGGANITASRLQQFYEMWRKLTEDCLHVVEDLEPETRWRLGGKYSENAIILSRFLKEVTQGSHSYIDGLGNISLPVLPQRRREARFTLLQPCVINFRGLSVAGMARDVSQNGLGVTSRAEYRLKEPVVVQLKGGRKLKGRVVWNRNGQQGIQLDVPLTFDDPLISR